MREKWEKEYTVKGLWYYVTSASDIDDDTMQQMKDRAEQEYNDHVESSWVDSESLESLTYMGDYLLEPVVGNGNELYLIYHVKVRDQYSNDDGSYDKVNDVYWYMHYGTILADGELICLTMEHLAISLRSRLMQRQTVFPAWYGNIMDTRHWMICMQMLWAIMPITLWWRMR